MRLALLLTLGAAAVAPTGRGTVVKRPLEAMVPIRGGQFTMGASVELQSAALELCREEIGVRNRVACVRDVVESEGPQRKVFLSPYSIDRVEVSVAAWRTCVQAGACSPAPLAVADERFLKPSLPITSVTWGEAAAYCAWRGGRLPTEAEWERAARGTDGRVWPWGNVLKPNAFNHGRFAGPDDAGSDFIALIRPDASDGATFLSPVGAHPDGASPDGIYDMAGNVMEWTSDYYRPESPQSSSVVNPHGPDAGAMRSLRHCTWRISWSWT